ncbi:EF-hand domain-containing protein, partial [Sphingomonas sp. Leaf21]|uniref:EF-hand domain-containing protein n=1 Tax=Sphingomonas sp. Leaf21 TaxID=2876550 RepID=UPI0022A8A094
RQGGGDRPDRAARPDRPAPQPVTADAYRARAVAMFDRLDTNHDGKIDATERAAAPRFGGRRRGDMAPGTQPAPPQDD